VRQPLLSRVAAMRATGRSAAELRDELAKTVPNLAAQVLALNDTLRLALTPEQKARLTAQADSFGRRLSPLVDSLAAAVQVEESSADASARRAARSRRVERVAAAQLLLNRAREAIRQVLEPRQWARLPLVVQQPAAQIVPPRKGIDARRGDW
jgi:hypothetical protein